jgi:hypothetical protein
MIGRMKLVSDSISTDTVEALSELLEQAKAGELKGFAFAAAYKRSQFVVNVAGELVKNPALARGMVAYLDDFLATEPYENGQATPT